MKEDFLNKYDKDRNPCQVSDGYFEDMKARLRKIPEEIPIRHKRPFPKTFWYWSTGIAATLLIVFSLWWPNTIHSTQQAENIPASAIEEYLLANYPYESNEEVIYSELSASDIPSTDFINLTDDEAQQFLNDNYDQTLQYDFL